MMTMEADVYNMQGEKVRKMELPAEIFEAPIKTDLMHQALVRQQANARLGTHQTKTRADVAGGGKKPWKQKGTGRARQGSSRSPNWKGGGGAHTPHPHSYTLQMPRQMRRAALRSALTVKAQEASIVLLEGMPLPEPKTRFMAQALDKLVGSSSVLILIPVKNEEYTNVIRSSNNIPDAKTLMASYLNIRDLLSFDKILVPVESLDVIATNLG
jgi:large subunit ribosomal protein L4